MNTDTVETSPIPTQAVERPVASGPAQSFKLSAIRGVCAVASGVALWGALSWLILDTGLLKPWFAYKPSAGLAIFVLLNAIAAMLYAGAQRWITGRAWVPCFAIAMLAVAATGCCVLYYAIEPVMFSELINQRLFYDYMQLLHALMTTVAPALAAFLIARSVYSLPSALPSRAVALLPVALAVACSGRLLVETLAMSVAGCFLVSARETLLARRLIGIGISIRTSVAAALASDRFVLWATFLSAFAVRAVYAARTATSEGSKGFVWDDAIVYEQAARDLSYEGYSLFLRAIYALSGHSFVAVRITQAFLGALICVLIFRLALLIAGRPVALIATFLAIGNGVLLCIPALQARETLLTFLLLLGVYCSLKWRDRSSIGYALAIGLIFGLTGLVKVIVAPAVLAMIWTRQGGRGIPRLRHAAIMVGTAFAIVATKPLVHRPMNIPVGRTGGEYAAMAYFAGNHPFASEDEWFNISQEQYEQLRRMGFHVGAGAGRPEVVAAWKQQYPRIAYCDRTTFETNTAILIRYNLTHPLRLAQLTAENFFTLFLGRLHHHRKFDTLYLLNDSAYSIVSRIFWLALAVVGFIYTWSSTAASSPSRQALLAIGGVIAYFILVYTIMIGSTIYSIPIVPYLLILQAAGLRGIWINATRRQARNSSRSRYFIVEQVTDRTQRRTACARG